MRLILNPNKKIKLIFITVKHTPKGIYLNYTYQKRETPLKTENFLWEDQPRENGFFDFSLLESNHLGNVLEVVTDRKLQIETTIGSGVLDYYSADVVSQSDYYPFGMVYSNTDFYVDPVTGLDVAIEEDDDYRYSFQGQEKDDEIKGEGNSVNYKYRMHDPRVGRFFAVDPLAPKYPHYTPYSFSGNKVIHAIELEGLEEFKISDAKTEDGTAIKVLTVTDVKAPFRILDENDKEISNFKYNCFQAQMCGYQFYTNDVDFNGNIGPSLITPNKPGQKKFSEVFNDGLVNFSIVTDDFEEVEPIFEKGTQEIEPFFEIIESGVESKTFTAASSETGEVTYGFAWGYMEQTLRGNTSVQIVDSQGNVIFEDKDNARTDNPTFTINSGETFTINVDRGDSKTDSEFRFFGGVYEGTNTDVTNDNCDEITCGDQ